MNFSLRPPRCVSTGPVVGAEMAIERERERDEKFTPCWVREGSFPSSLSLHAGREREHDLSLAIIE